MCKKIIFYRQLNSFFLIAAASLFSIAAASSLISCNFIGSHLRIGDKLKIETPGTVKSIPPDGTASSGQLKQVLSEQPDQAAFNEYFTELGLGKLPENGNLPSDLKKNDNIFISNGLEQIVIYGELLLDAKLSTAVYDAGAGKNIRDKSELPMVVKKGGFAESEPVNFPPGKYEYKIWAGSKLTGVFPFEVRP
jgi:hypothetical protein